MLPYERHLKSRARSMRREPTDAELRLWGRIRGRRIAGVQFYRQRPIGHYIVDFYAPAVKLVVEVDGAQHYEAEGLEYDRVRTHYLESLGLHLVRFDNRQVLVETAHVLDQLTIIVAERLAPSAGGQE